MPAPAAQDPTYTSAESPAEKRFVATIQRDLMNRFPTAASAQRAGYVRYTGVDDTGAISYANCRWTSRDPAHPSQLWYDTSGKLLGADYSIPLATHPSRPQLWGVNPGRWAKFDGHQHWVARDPKTGKLVYWQWMPDAKFAAGGGIVNHPAAHTLVAMGKVQKTSDVVHLFHFPPTWDLTVWVKPNPNGAFAVDNPAVSTHADGSHDFDFEFGAWNVSIAQRLHPLSGAAQWTHYNGTHVVYTLWNGQANYGVMEIDGPRGHAEGLQTRIYDPSTKQWSLRFASSSDGALGAPSVGTFTGGKGVFYSHDTMGGRAVLVRTTTSNMTHDAYRDDIAVSPDNGKTWTTYWRAQYTRRASAPPLPADTAHGQGRGFDFEFGSWKAQLKRLLHPLSGSHEWAKYSGISVVHKIWNGRANIGELDLSGPAGRIHGLSLRLYSPQTKEWSVYWANAKGGGITTPLVGGFHSGRGYFMDRETFDGKPILARFVFTFSGPNAFRIVQSFSPDNGKTWEPNWISAFTRS